VSVSVRAKRHFSPFDGQLAECALRTWQT